MAKSTKDKKVSTKPVASEPLPEIKSKVLLKDKKFVTIRIGKENILASMQIQYILEMIYEKTSKRASWDNFFKRWRPTVLKLDGQHIKEIEKEILG